jgi:hypothetical protein
MDNRRGVGQVKDSEAVMIDRALQLSIVFLSAFLGAALVAALFV